jgi:putative ABC transport system substrate-binding protein
MQTLYGTLATRSHHCFYLTNGFSPPCRLTLRSTGRADARFQLGESRRGPPVSLNVGQHGAMWTEHEFVCECVGRRSRYPLLMKRQACPNRVRVGLLAVIGLAMLVVPSPAKAEGPASLRRIAFLSSDTTCATSRGFRALLEGLRSFGYREGENIAIDCRSANGKYERLDSLAAELVQLNPAVLVAAAAPASIASKRATNRIPIISVYSADPVGLGLVASLARPNANVTGISALASDYAAKSLQLLKEVAPRTSRVGVLGHTANPTYAIYRRELEPAGRALGLTLDFAGVEGSGEIEPALSLLARRGADAFLVMHQPLTFDQRENIVKLVSQHGLPAMYGSREAVELGGLISYAASVADTFRRAAFFVDKVLRGAKIADLPFEQPTKFELVVNLNTAKTLGLAIPPSVRLRADQVIE